ncbi:hypothetical protein BH11PSE8_BH11PSE8_11530 [soil metagenome]
MLSNRKRTVLTTVRTGGLALLVAGCGSMTGGSARFQPEQFGSTTTHSRNYPASETMTCEAARRALLSQGYVITLADADHINGKKNFQPDAEVHVEIEFHVVCAPDGRRGKKTTAFVNALQDRYALKKSNNSASLGVGAFGSLSVPFTSSDDSLVKVASETITNEPFYERFFALMQRYLTADILDDAPPEGELPMPPPMPSRAASGVASGAKPSAPAASSAEPASASAASPPAASASTPATSPADSAASAPTPASSASAPQPAASAASRP